MSTMRLALIQLKTGMDKQENISRALHFIKVAAQEHHARVISLPECFNSPYGTQYFPQYAESIPGPTTEALSAAAKAHNIYLVGGSIPELREKKLYNTATVFGPDGALIRSFQKIHLFDIDIPGKITFKESDSINPGTSLCTFVADGCRIGLGICYDIRFAELAMLYAKMECDLLIYPGAFNMTTGPAHWKLLQQCRALDNQLYVAGVSPARDESASYVAYGHSAIVNPWGEVIAEASETEQILTADIDPQYVKQVRSQIPISKQRRRDLYVLESCGKSDQVVI